MTVLIELGQIYGLESAHDSMKFCPFAARDDASAQSEANDSTRSGYCSHGTQIIEYLMCGASCESSDHGTQILQDLCAMVG